MYPLFLILTPIITWTIELTKISRPANIFVPRKTFHQGIKTINEFVNPFIDEALLLSPDELAGKTKSEEGYTFLHELAHFTRDRKVLRDQLVAVLLAGRDTTASTLSWTFYELARKPEIVQKLREEILETVGLNRPPTYNDLKSMKYLQVSFVFPLPKPTENIKSTRDAISL